MKKTIIGAVVMAVCTALTLGIGVLYNTFQTKSADSDFVVNEDDEIAVFDNNNAASLILWYSNNGMADYFDAVVNAYSAEKNVAMKASYIPESEMLEKINSANIDDGQESADVYFIESESLEKAFLAGLTETINDMDIFNEDNFSSTAISACTYKNKMIAYPLCYETSVLAYNTDYVDSAPATFDEILNAAADDEVEIPEGITSILKWDVGSLQYNFGFAGSYLEFGGKNGDDENILDLNNENVIMAMEYYYDLYQFFSIDINQADYDNTLEEFINGNIMYTIINSKSISTLEQSGMNYDITVLPDLTDQLTTTTLSLTTVAIINPYAENETVAEDFVKYICYEHAYELYDKCGGMPCAKVENYESGKMNTLTQAYDNSVNLPKLMSASDYWVYLEIAMNEVWNGEDIEETMTALQDKMSE